MKHSAVDASRSSRKFDERRCDRRCVAVDGGVVLARRQRRERFIADERFEQREQSANVARRDAPHCVDRIALSSDKPKNNNVQNTQQNGILVLRVRVRRRVRRRVQRAAASIVPRMRRAATRLPRAGANSAHRRRARQTTSRAARACRDCIRSSRLRVDRRRCARHMSTDKQYK